MANVDYLDFLVDRGILCIHHEAVERGYCYRTVPPEVEAYHGRFGHGYKVHYPTRRSTMYHPIAYYVWSEPEYESYREFFEHGMRGVK